MSEVDVVAEMLKEMRERAQPVDWRDDTRMTIGRSTLTTWADHVERLQAENASYCVDNIKYVLELSDLRGVHRKIRELAENWRLDAKRVAARTERVLAINSCRDDLLTLVPNNKGEQT